MSGERVAIVISYEDQGCRCQRVLVLVTTNGAVVRHLAGGNGQAPFWAALDADRRVAAHGAQEVTPVGLLEPAAWELRAGGITSALALPGLDQVGLDALVADLVGRAAGS